MLSPVLRLRLLLEPLLCLPGRVRPFVRDLPGWQRKLPPEGENR